MIDLYLGNSKVVAEEEILSQDQLSELLLTQLHHRMYILRGATSSASEAAVYGSPGRREKRASERVLSLSPPAATDRTVGETVGQ